MLSSLLESGTMSMSDADSVLYEEEAQKYMDVVEIPKIGYSIHRQVHHMTVPRRFSRTGGRHPLYGKCKRRQVGDIFRRFRYTETLVWIKMIMKT